MANYVNKYLNNSNFKLLQTRLMSQIRHAFTTKQFLFFIELERKRRHEPVMWKHESRRQKIAFSTNIVEQRKRRIKLFPSN
jgi:hypothetical protein